MSARSVSVLCLLLLTGCLHPVEIPTVRLSAPPRGADSLSESLGVVPLADLRPREQKRGKSPWLIPLILWNQRIGRYVTSSEDLGGDVSADVSEAIATALSGWRFGRGYVLAGDDDATIADYCDTDGLAYVVTGEIHHLYGAVRQRAWLFIIPVPWFLGWLSGNQVGDPVGVARLTLRIQECSSGEQIASRRFVSEGVFPQLSPSAAAQRAFDRLIREVSDLSRVPADTSPPQAVEPAPQPADAPKAGPAEPEPESERAPEPEPEPEPERDESGGPVLVPL